MAESARLDELQRKYAENPRRYFAPLANEYRKAGELSTAVAICREELARFPGHMSGHVVLGQALYESRRPTEAQAAFERALALDPENLIALRHLGDIARDRGDLREARSWYERVLEADPRNDDIAAQLSRLAPSYGRPTQAPAYVPHPAVPVAPPAATPPRAAEPLLEPLEWTALDLGLPGQPLPEAPATDAAPAGAPAEVPRTDASAPLDGLLDVAPTELLPPAPRPGPAATAESHEREAAESFSVISDEVSAIADDHGLIDPIEAREDHRHEEESGPTPAVIDDAPVDASVASVAEQPFVVEAPQAESAVLWDDLLPSLDLDADESPAVRTSDDQPPRGASEPAVTEPVERLGDPIATAPEVPAAEEQPVSEAPPAADDAVVEQPVDPAQPDREDERVLDLRLEDPEPSTAVETNAAEPELAEVATTPDAAEPEAAWQLAVEPAHDVELTPFERSGPAPERAAAEPVDATAGALAWIEIDAADVEQPAAAEPSLGDETLSAIGSDEQPRHEEPAAPTPEVATAIDAVAIDEAVDFYDFLIPFAEPASSHVAADDARSERTAVSAGEPVEPQRTAELPFFRAAFSDTISDESPSDASPAAPFARPAAASYDPVVGLDVPPAPSVPPVLAAAVPALDDEDGGSPTPGGAFVTETMAQLLSQQGHVEQALEVYAQLEASRPDDDALRGRADALRARLAPPVPAPEPPQDAPPLDAGAPTAAAFFASLALDDPADAAPAQVDESEPSASAPTDDVVATAAPEVIPEEPTRAAPETFIGFFDAPAEERDERAAARLAQAFGTQVEPASSLVSAIFDAPPASAERAAGASPEPAPAAPPPPPVVPPAPSADEVPYGLGEFSFERFFAGLEEDAPPTVPTPEPEREPSALAGQPPAHDPWPEPPGSAPQTSGPRASDDRTPGSDLAAPRAPAANEDEDLAQFNAWLKGLLEP